MYVCTYVVYARYIHDIHVCMHVGICIYVCMCIVHIYVYMYPFVCLGVCINHEAGL